MSDIAIVDSSKPPFLDRVGLGGFPWVTASVLYTISYGWFWNARNSYWSDDWWSFYDPGVPKAWAQHGLAPWIIFDKWLYQITGPGFLRLVIFVVFFLAGICFYGISKKILYLTERLKRFATLLFILLPFNSARVTLMTFHYSTAYFYFFFAWYLIITFKSVWIKFFAACLFFLSFQMHSLPVFIALPILHLFSLEASRGWRILLTWLRNNWFLVLASPTYVILRRFFWNAVPELKYHTVNSGQVWFLFRILIFLGTATLMIWVLGRFLTTNNRQASRLICCGALTIYLGLTPYIIGGYFNKPEGLPLLYVLYFLGRTREWESRHLMLQPIGMTLLIIGLFAFVSVKFKKLQLSLKFFSILMCVLLNVGFGFEYMTDYAKQNEIIRELKVVGYNNEISEYIFIDKSAYLNAKGRRSDTELPYLLKVAYGSKLDRSITVSLQCRSSNDVRLIVIDGEASYWNALQSWFNRGNFGFSVEILDGPTPCTAELVENRGRQNQIPLLLYFIDAEK